MRNLAECDCTASAHVEDTSLALWIPEITSPYAQVLSAWQFTPPITLGLALLAWLYVNGMRRRAVVSRRPGRWNWRSVAFFAGLVTLYGALQSPLDFLADHFFCIHQVQHLILMMISPILLLAPAPAGTLAAGVPRRIRHVVLGPLLRSRAIQAIFALLTHPVTATILSGGTLYFWMAPSMYDRALLDERIHDLMHFSMLFAGLLFWWRVLDFRRPPIGIPYLYRAAMLKVNLMMVAFLGVVLTAKQYALYRGSERLDLLHVTTLTDERIGGCVLWFGGCSILVVALAVTLGRWIRDDATLTDRREVSRRSSRRGGAAA